MIPRTERARKGCDELQAAQERRAEQHRALTVALADCSPELVLAAFQRGDATEAQRLIALAAQQTANVVAVYGPLPERFAAAR